MSYLEIYKIGESGDFSLEKEIKNSFRGAMAVWLLLSNKYLGGKNEGFPNKVWELQSSNDISETDLICLLSTLDKVVVYKKDIPKLIQAFNDFDEGTSLPEQAVAIQELLDEDPEMIGIAFNQTSIVEGPWRSFEEDSDGNTIPINITDVEFWELFAEEKFL